MDSAIVNLDVMNAIMAVCDQCSVSRLMRTCRTLNCEGVQHLFSTYPWLDSEESVTSFLLFVCASGRAADIFHRLEYLEGLSIEADDAETAAAMAPALTVFFTVFAPHAEDFVSLRIGGTERLLTADPSLSDAISALTSLEYLTLSDVRKQSLDMLSKLSIESELIRVDVNGDFELMFETEEWESDLTATLAGTRTTLRHLEITNTTISTLSVVCYPSLHTLSLTCVDKPVTRLLVRAFPNLSVLSASDLIGYFVDTDVAEVSPQRDANIADQLRWGTWRVLRQFKGSLAMLYILGLTCPVPDVDLSYEYDGAFDLSMLAPVVLAARPTHLALRLNYLLDFYEGDFAIFSEDCFKSVVSLKVSLRVYAGETDLDMEPALDAMIRAIGRCGLDSVELDINWSLIRGFGATRAESASAGPAETYLSDLDPNVLVDRLVSASPSLRIVVVSLCGIHLRSRIARRDVVGRGQEERCKRG
ncbi:hypothetical protein C8Q76DRAFT_735231 [Earliella scabrosa]|nr:hypothetical protein C8Q76DRAFT_735231 [Earliella scabrosa]